VRYVRVYVDGPFDGHRDPESVNPYYSKLCSRPTSLSGAGNRAVYQFERIELVGSISTRIYLFKFLLPAAEAEEYVAKNNLMQGT
jgi:hypothetical protein